MSAAKRRQGSAPAFVRLGPWPLGVDNVHPADHAVFQAGMDVPARLVAATNLDLDDSGRARRRPGVAVVEALDGVSPVGALEVSGRVFVQGSDGVLLEVSGGVAAARLSGLVARATLCAHAGLIYGSDGTTHFELDGTTARTWGLPVPAITLASTAGTLPAGTYLVQASYSDARGNEGGVSDLASITLTTAGAINVALSVSASTTGATHLNVYAGEVSQPETTFVAKVALAALPYKIAAAVTAADPPKTAAMAGPPAGLVGLVSHRAYLMAWRDNVLFRSEPQEPHLFDPEAFFPLERTVRAAESVAGGLWVATSGGICWIAGESPENWVPVWKSRDASAAGSMLIRGSLIPKLQTSDLVALFATEAGLVAGLPGGSLAHLTEGRYRFDPGARVSMAYVERDDLRQILIAIAPVPTTWVSLEVSDGIGGFVAFEVLAEGATYETFEVVE